MNRNPMCGGSHCVSTDGQVRVLPTGGDSNAILCQACFDHEFAWRKQRNEELGWNAFKVPTWESLEIYSDAL